MENLGYIEIGYQHRYGLSKLAENFKFAKGTGFFGRIEASEIGAAMVAESASSKAVSVLNTFKCKWQPLNCQE
jgi:hypothetical protein